MTAWAHAARLDHAEFAERFLGRAADDPVAGDLRAAAMGAATAKSHADLAETAGHLADAMQAIGLDRWQRFLADAEERAKDPATIAAVAKSRQPSDLRSKDDSIRPVYPVEAAFGIAAAGIAAGGAAVARAVGGAILRQVLPKAGPQSGGAAGDSAEGAANAEKPTNTGEEDSKATGLTKPSLPANADDLLKEGWEETTHPDATAEGHRTFVNPKTGQTVQFDKAQPGETGWKGQDHYHMKNPDTTSKRDFYLDSGGRAVPKGSEPSHIPPNR